MTDEHDEYEILKAHVFNSPDLFSSDQIGSWAIQIGWSINRGHLICPLELYRNLEHTYQGLVEKDTPSKYEVIGVIVKDWHIGYEVPNELKCINDEVISRVCEEFRQEDIRVHQVDGKILSDTIQKVLYGKVRY